MRKIRSARNRNLNQNPLLYTLLIRFLFSIDMHHSEIKKMKRNFRKGFKNLETLFYQENFGQNHVEKKLSFKNWMLLALLIPSHSLHWDAIHASHSLHWDAIKNSFRCNEIWGNRVGSWWLMLIVGASFKHSALKTRDPDWMELPEESSKQFYSAHPIARNRKHLHKVLKIFHPE